MDVGAGERLAHVLKSPIDALKRRLHNDTDQEMTDNERDRSLSVGADRGRKSLEQLRPTKAGLELQFLHEDDSPSLSKSTSNASRPSRHGVAELEDDVKSAKRSDKGGNGAVARIESVEEEGDQTERAMSEQEECVSKKDLEAEHAKYRA